MDVWILWGPAAIGALWAATRVTARIRLSRAKHPSLSGHSKIARRIARILPFYEYDESEFFASDGAPPAIVAERRAGFSALAALFEERFHETARQTELLSRVLSDLQFTAAYRVPFQYTRLVRENLRGGSLLASADGVFVTDLDGNRLYDVGGSYGVNLFGIEFYRQCIDRGADHVRALGPVLGGLHPLVLKNAEHLQRISGLDEVSFHMSGTEAVMQAVRLARYHTRRTHLVRFNGAYHGWWGEVQPGIGNPVDERHTYTLSDMSQRSLGVLRTRGDIACVLVNPLQSLHPNASAPADSSLVDSSRDAQCDRLAYADWLRELRAVCTRRGIVLILDEVFTGFRLAPRGAQEYFGVQADMVTYGKTLGGGLPVGVLCGKAALMKRFRADRPADICFARGTFNSHPYVMGAMHEFLEQWETPRINAIYATLDACWDARAATFNRRLEEHRLPLRVANLSSIWTICFTQPSRYNWMLQYYLRAAALSLSWVGTGRLIFSLAYTDEDFAAVCDRFIQAAEAMKRDGWWWQGQGLSNAAIRRKVLRELLARLAPAARQPVAAVQTDRVTAARDAEQSVRRAAAPAVRGDTAGHR